MIGEYALCEIITQLNLRNIKSFAFKVKLNRNFVICYQTKLNMKKYIIYILLHDIKFVVLISCS